MKWLSSAPANLMLMGEHSVVYGQKAIAASVDQRLTIEWQTRNDQQIYIVSELGNHQTYLDELKDHPNLRWIMACLRYYRPELDCGLEITIHSEFKSILGLGSSAAVLAAMLVGLNHYLNKKALLREMFHIGLKIIHDIQGRGSGTDLAATLAGGLILFDPRKQEIKSIPTNLSTFLVYSGYKTPTAEVLKLVADHWQDAPEMADELYALMGKVTEKAYHALQKQQLDSFYRMVQRYQGLMDTLGVNDETLCRLIYQLRQQPEVNGCKISGSGLGDCVIGFGQLKQLPESLQEFDWIPIQLSSEGAKAQTIEP